MSLCTCLLSAVLFWAFTASSQTKKLYFAPLVSQLKDFQLKGRLLLTWAAEQIREDPRLGGHGDGHGDGDVTESHDDSI